MELEVSKPTSISSKLWRRGWKVARPYLLLTLGNGHNVGGLSKHRKLIVDVAYVNSNCCDAGQRRTTFVYCNHLFARQRLLRLSALYDRQLNYEILFTFIEIIFRIILLKILSTLTLPSSVTFKLLIPVFLYQIFHLTRPINVNYKLLPIFHSS